MQVLLRGQPNWDACLRVVDAVVNVSAPCAEQDHRPSCVLGAPQPELQGNFMGLTGEGCMEHLPYLTGGNISFHQTRQSA